MRIVTWNVNSIRAHQERVLAWLRDFSPEVLCLQELKTEDSGYPFKEIEALGYQSAVFGQKTYNGVAIVTRLPMTDIRMGFDDGVEDPQARLISANVAGVRVISAYVPNGGELSSDKYVYKQAWLQRLRTYLDRHHSADEPLAICGDFNIAPEAQDVQNLLNWDGSILYNPQMHAALAHVLDFGLRDAFRQHRQEKGLYSWWDYRGGGFQRNDGLRIDHVYATKSLASIDAFVDRNERRGDKPSDHAPLGVVFAAG